MAKVLAMCDVLKIELGQLTNGVPTWVTWDIYPPAVRSSVQIFDQVAHAQNDVGWSRPPSSRTSTEPSRIMLDCLVKGCTHRPTMAFNE